MTGDPTELFGVIEANSNDGLEPCPNENAAAMTKEIRNFKATPTFWSSVTPRSALSGPSWQTLARRSCTTSFSVPRIAHVRSYSCSKDCPKSCVVEMLSPVPKLNLFGTDQADGGRCNSGYHLPFNALSVALLAGSRRIVGHPETRRAPGSPIPKPTRCNTQSTPVDRIA